MIQIDDPRFVNLALTSLGVVMATAQGEAPFLQSPKMSCFIGAVLLGNVQSKDSYIDKIANVALSVMANNNIKIVVMVHQIYLRHHHLPLQLEWEDGNLLALFLSLALEYENALQMALMFFGMLLAIILLVMSMLDQTKKRRREFELQQNEAVRKARIQERDHLLASFPTGAVLVEKNEEGSSLLPNKEFLMGLHDQPQEGEHQEFKSLKAYHEVQLKADESEVMAEREPVSLTALVQEQHAKPRVFSYRTGTSQEYFEVKGCILDDSTSLVTFTPIKHLIRAQQQAMQTHYQEAVTATMSHEQLNPLNSIINFADILESHIEEMVEGGEVAPSSMGSDKFVQVERSQLERQQDALRIIKSSSALLLLMNSGMLHLALLKQGKLDVASEVITDFVQTLGEFTSFFADHLDQKDLALDIDKDIVGDPAVISAIERYGVLVSRSMYQEILYNIFMNACKFNRQNGAIKVSLKVSGKVEELLSFMEARPKEVELITTIEDTGIGMTKEQLGKVFNLFSDLSQPGSSSQSLIFSNPGLQNSRSGIGLGLHLSLQLARQLNGDIRIESTFGKGTKVDLILKLPVYQGISPFSVSSEARRPSASVQIQEMLRNHHLQHPNSSRNKVPFRRQAAPFPAQMEKKQRSSSIAYVPKLNFSRKNLSRMERGESYKNKSLDNQIVDLRVSRHYSGECSSKFNQFIHAIAEEKDAMSLSEESSIKETPRYSMTTEELSPMLSRRIQSFPENVTMYQVAQDHRRQMQIRSITVPATVAQSREPSPPRAHTFLEDDSSSNLLTLPKPMGRPVQKRSSSQVIRREDVLELKKEKTCSPILIMEDSVFNQEILKIIIQKGFEIDPDVADNGAEGLEAFKKKTRHGLLGECQCGEEDCPNKFYKLIITDVNMPVMDGVESAQAILEFQNRLEMLPEQRCTIIALTAYTNVDCVQRCTLAGITKVLGKPAQRKTICKEIKKWIGKDKVPMQ